MMLSLSCAAPSCDCYAAVIVNIQVRRLSRVDMNTVCLSGGIDNCNHGTANSRSLTLALNFTRLKLINHPKSRFHTCPLTVVCGQNVLLPPPLATPPCLSSQGQLVSHFEE